MLLSEIDNFFQNHPLGGSYFAHSDSERNAIAAVARRDVMAAIAGCPQLSAEESELVDAAIAEQTIFLMLNPEYLTGAYTRTTASGSGDSSRRFSDQLSPLGQRSAALIAPLLKRATVENASDLPPAVTLLRG